MRTEQRVQKELRGLIEALVHDDDTCPLGVEEDAEHGWTWTAP